MRVPGLPPAGKTIHHGATMSGLVRATRSKDWHANRDRSSAAAARTHEGPGPQHFLWFTPALGVLLGGYLFFSKSFAYLHVPGTPIFVGEIVLALGVVEALLIRSPWRHLISTSPVLKALLVSTAVGGFRLLSDFPRYQLDAARDSALWYYGIYAFLVAAAAIREPTFIPRLLSWYRRAIPWFFLWAPIAIIAAGFEALSSISVPGSTTPINSFKSGDLTVQVALALAFLWLGVDRVHGMRPVSRPTMIFLSVVGTLTVGIGASQTRGGFVAALILLAITFAFLPALRRRLIVLGVGGGLSVVLALILVLDVRLQGGSRDVSLGQLGTNVASLFGAETEDQLAGTVEWRLGYWSQVFNDLTSSRAWASGLGFGPILPERYQLVDPVIDPNQPPLRNAHNSHLTVIARVGFLGFTAWLAVWGVYCLQTIRYIRRRRRQYGRDGSWALAVWLLVAAPGFLVNAFFDPSLEGPQAAIWLYVLLGLGAAVTHVASRALPPRRTTAGSPAHQSGPIT